MKIYRKIPHSASCCTNTGIIMKSDHSDKQLPSAFMHLPALVGNISDTKFSINAGFTVDFNNSVFIETATNDGI